MAMAATLFQQLVPLFLLSQWVEAVVDPDAMVVVRAMVVLRKLSPVQHRVRLSQGSSSW